MVTTLRSENRVKEPQDLHLYDEPYYRDLWRKHVVRLFLTYVAPFMILTAYLYIQYRAIDEEQQRLHLRAVAESQANTLDLFLSERLVNLENVIDDPRMPLPPTSAFMEEALTKLKRASAAFVDLGHFNDSGKQVAYAGPLPSLAQRSYATESWFLVLERGKSDFVITDIYLGFRKIPHFTIGVSRMIEGQVVILRATLTPEKMYEFISSFEGSHEVLVSIVNREGLYQLVTPRLGAPLESSPFVPIVEPRLGTGRAELFGKPMTYAYSWSRQADWALVVQPAQRMNRANIASLSPQMVVVAAIVMALSIGIVFFRAGRLVEAQVESDRNRIQLGQAAKLASIGELAAGIAHEINNPLAAIGAEAGLVKDLMDPRFGEPVKPEDLAPHLDSIQELVLRCRDITHKLLKFVRKSDVQLKRHDIHSLIDEVVDDLMGNAIMLANIEVERAYDPNLPEIITDGPQLQQVFLNIVNNAVDAVEGGPGKIKITTQYSNESFRVEISDTGKGMTLEQLDKVFLPFFTTKEVGKGTGLGMSVSYGIVKSLGGDIKVESVVGRGTAFDLILPVRRGIVSAKG